MIDEIGKIFEEAKKLSPQKQVELIEKLLTSFDTDERKRLDNAWAIETQSRLDAYKAGLIEAIPIDEVLEEIDRMDLQ